MLALIAGLAVVVCGVEEVERKFWRLFGLPQSRVKCEKRY